MEWSFDLDGRRVVYNVDGASDFGSDGVLLDGEDDLTAATDWSAEGYTVVPFVEPAAWDELVAGIATLVRQAVEEVLDRSVPNFRLEKYHEVVTDDVSHRAVVRRTYHDQHVPGDLPIETSVIVRRVADVCKTALTLENPQRPTMFNVRICRPLPQDTNPLHRDAWMDRFKNAVNIFVPIAGSTAETSLALVPGSHRWKESEIRRTAAGARVDGVVYTVPSVVATRRALRLIRPNPGSNEVLIFSPYLIHGGSANFSGDTTRVSLEMRFRRA